MIALIDADSFLYKVGFAMEDVIDWELDETDHYSNLPLQKRTIDDLITSILTATGCEGYELWLTGKGNFRNDNPLGYKEKRKDLRKPTDYDKLRAYMIEKHNAKVAEGYEADDMVVYIKTHSPDKYVLCAVDKDVLFQTEGTHYNYNKDEFITITKDMAVHYKYYQCLMGDPTDGYKGCKGIGKVKAMEKLGEPGKHTEAELWDITVKTYVEKGHTKEDAINTMRLADMHQLKEENGLIVVSLYDPITRRLEAC